MVRKMARQIATLPFGGQWTISATLASMFGRTPVKLAQWIQRELELVGALDVQWDSHQVVFENRELRDAVTFYRPRNKERNP